MKSAMRLAVVLAALAVHLGCGWHSPDPKAEGHEMPIEITEEDPVSSPGIENVPEEDK